MFTQATDIDKPTDKFTGFYRAVVVDNIDPLESGRVQVRVMPMFTGVDASALPWAIMADSSFGGASNVGAVNTPIINSHVWVFFENGDHRFPVFFAGAPAIQNGTPDIPTASREQDPAVAATIAANMKTGIAQADGSTWDEPGSAHATVYPHNHVWRTESGILVELDDTDGGTRIHIFHPTGSRTEIDDAGNETHHVEGNRFTVVVGDDKVYITGNGDVTIDGNMGIKVGGNAKIAVSGNADIDADGNAHVGAGVAADVTAPTVTISGSDAVNITSSTVVAVSAPSITLN